MRVSQRVSSATFFASFTGCALPPIAGPLPPAWEVEKNTGSMRSKSPSACMRCTRTEPTIPRQPIRPTFMATPVKNALQRRHHGVAHLGGAHPAGAVFVNIGRSAAVREYFFHRRLDSVRPLVLVER